MISVALFALLTFDLQEHQLLVRHSTVVGHLLRDADTAQADAAEILFAGQAGESHFSETRGFIHCNEDKTAQKAQLRWQEKYRTNLRQITTDKWRQR